jgi:hypothetical protein
MYLGIPAVVIVGIKKKFWFPISQNIQIIVFFKIKLYE